MIASPMNLPTNLVGADGGLAAEALACLRANATFAPLAQSALVDLVASGVELRFAEQDILLRQGDVSDSALLLLEGEVEVFVETSFGPVELALLSRAALIGDIGVFTGVARTATVRARSSVRALRLERASLHAFGQQNASFLHAVLGQLGHRFETFNRAIGTYTNALAALEQHDFDLRLLDELRHPIPELADFSQSFRRMAEQITLRQAQREEMAAAAAIQRAMLPRPLRPTGEMARVDLYAEMRPAREVGGDFYDFFLLDDHRLVLTVGDVSGKGAPAALFMAITQTVMRLALRQSNDLAAAVTLANHLLAADNPESMFATMFCGVLDLREGMLTWCNCGHNPTLLLTKTGGLKTLDPTGVPLGARLKAQYRTETAALAAGDSLFLYTDGVTEATNAEDEQFGEARLAAAVERLRDQPAREFVRGVIRTVDAFSAGAPQFDDMIAETLIFLPTGR